MWKEVKISSVLVLAAIGVTRGDNLINIEDGESSMFGNMQHEAQDWQRLIKAIENGEILNNFDAAFYDVRSNETGLFNGTGSGNWNRFGYSTWIVKGNTANISVYTIEKLNVTSMNMTLLDATYIHAQLTANSSMAEWCKQFNSRLMLQNETLNTLSNTLGSGSGYLEWKSNSSAHYRENETQRVNRTKDGKVSTWKVQKNGIFNTYEKYSNFILFSNGNSSSGVDDLGTAESVPQSPSLLDRVLRESFKSFNQGSEWSERLTGLIGSGDTIRKFNTTSVQVLNQASLEEPIKRSSNSSGYIWEDVHSLNMDNMPEALNKILPSFLRFLF